MEIAFGPAPSRRLGHSLGINNIPAKHCSYSCVYCQVGATRSPEIIPRAFYSPAQILQEVQERVDAVRSRNEPIDYLTFVPDGEPTLDITLGAAIDALRRDVQQFAKVLEAWPALRKASATLAERVAGDATWLRP